MKVFEVTENKKQYLPLLLLADEQESMIDRYLEKGRMFVLEDNGIKAECVVTLEAENIAEVKNIAVCPAFQGLGYGRKLLAFVEKKFGKTCRILQLGTGDSPRTVPFYERCGFVRTHNIPNFFTDHYDHPIWEDGVQLIDMVYFQKELQKETP